MGKFKAVITQAMPSSPGTSTEPSNASSDLTQTVEGIGNLSIGDGGGRRGEGGGGGGGRGRETSGHNSAMSQKTAERKKKMMVVAAVSHKKKKQGSGTLAGDGEGRGGTENGDEIDGEETAEGRSEKMKGPWFVYMMIQLGGPCKNEAKILIAREPYADVHRHNTGEINDKGTKAARGLWQPEMIIGAFDTWYQAEEFRQLWVTDSRGIKPRRDRGIKLVLNGAIKDDIKCYDKRLVPCQLNDWLAVRHMDALALPDDVLRRLYYDTATPTTFLT